MQSSNTASAAATASPIPSVPTRKHKRAPRTTMPYLRSSSAGNSPSASGSQSSTSAESPPSSSHTPPSVRWPCGLPACTKSFTRPYDLIRHLVAAHHPHVASASDEGIMAAGVPRDLVYRVHELLERTNRCERCGKAFSRRDALVRHVIEQKHGSLGPQPPVGEFLDPMIPVDEFLSRLGLGPAVLSPTPALGLNRDFGTNALFGPTPLIPANQDPWQFPPDSDPALGLPSLDDWESLIVAWAASHEG